MKGKIIIKVILSFFLISAIALIITYIVPNIDNSPNIICSKNIKLEEGTSCLSSEKLLVQFVSKDTIWASHNLTVYKSTNCGKTFIKQFTFAPSFLSKLFIKNNPLVKKVFGFTVNLKILEIRPLLLDINWRVYRSTDAGKSFVEVNKGITPLSQGVDKDDEGNIYYGEYPGRNYNGPVRVFFSSDRGANWETIYSFNNIKHIHSIRYDKYTDRMWITTGDLDDECYIGYLETIKNKVTFNSLFGGSQRYRAVSLLFDSNYVYWGMDSPRIQNYILRYNRKTGKAEEIEKINGPAYFSTILNCNLMVIGTAKEGCKGEWDNKISIWTSRNGREWKRTISIARLGEIHKAVPFMPLGKGSKLVITPNYTKECNEDLLVFNLN